MGGRHDNLRERQRWKRVKGITEALANEFIVAPWDVSLRRDAVLMPNALHLVML
jgi:hypothetical protein